MRADQIRQLLPVAFQVADGDEPLAGLLGVMEGMHQPVEEVLRDLDRYVDPRRCPPRFVPYLARWVGLGWLVEEPLPASGFPTGLGRLRELVAQSAPLAELRGTALGMQRFLTLLLGTADIVVDEASEGPFTATVLVPASARPHGALVRRVVEELKPAHLQVATRFTEAPAPEEEPPAARPPGARPPDQPEDEVA